MLTWNRIIILLYIVILISVAVLATNACWTSPAIRECIPSSG
jgi:hypothetical protein